MSSQQKEAQLPGMPKVPGWVVKLEATLQYACGAYQTLLKTNYSKADGNLLALFVGWPGNAQAHAPRIQNPVRSGLCDH